MYQLSKINVLNTIFGVKEKTQQNFTVILAPFLSLLGVVRRGTF
ncbi:hypothetical protein LMG14418_0148 [Lactococcus lactis subsp. lactis]|nr:hypothetical protein LMG14418_0148 [Lactococcus lactis subsp. lactis]